MDYVEKKQLQNDHSLFFLIITCLLIFSIFSSILINKNAKIIHYLSDAFYSSANSFDQPIIQNQESNQIEYTEFRNGEVNEVFIKGKLQECLDRLSNDNKISQNEIGKLLHSINNLYEIDNIWNLKTEINLINTENQNSLQDVKIKLDDFRYLSINNINNSLIVNKIFDADGIQNQLENNIEQEIALNAINHKKIFEITKNYSLDVKKIRLDQNLSLIKNIPAKSLIGFTDKKNKTVKLTTLTKKDENGSNSIVYFSLENNGKSLRYYKHSNGRYYSKNGQSMLQQQMFSMPISGKYRISSPFGMRVHPILRYRRMHNGVDLASPYGTPIKAAGTGKIEFVGRKSGYGKYILINHGGGYKTGYGHMSAFAGNLRTGSSVTKGQLIGKVGTSGLSSGPHLHYEMIKDKKFTNPLSASPTVLQNMNRKDYKKFSSEAKNLDYIVQQLKEINSKKSQIV